MSIKVLYFASLKELTLRDADEFVAEQHILATPRIIWQNLNPNMPLSESVLTAVNMEYVNLDAEVRDGDELAFFPPVTGG